MIRVAQNLIHEMLHFYVKLLLFQTGLNLSHVPYIKVKAEYMGGSCAVLTHA